MDNFEKCLHACRDALIIEPDNLKALYRASVSLRLLNQLEQAEKYLSKALTIDPQNREIVIEAGKLKDALDLALQAMNKKTENFKESFVEYSMKFIRRTTRFFLSYRVDLDDVLSCLAISDEFRSKVESLLFFSDTSESTVIVQRENFSETEFYYIQLFAKQKQLTLENIDDQTLHIRK